MSNPKAKAIQRFSKQAFNHIKTFEKALNDYPKVQTFVIVATKDPNVFSFVPKQLERFAPDVVCLGTIDRPDANTAPHLQLIQKALSILKPLGPRYQFDSLVDSILDYKIHKNLVETFYLVSLTTEHAVKHDLSWKDQAIAIADALRNDFMDMASRRLNGYKAEYEGINLYRSLTDLDITTVCGLPRIALDGEPISKDVIWSWIEKQGLNPDDNFYSKEIEERLGNLALNSQLVAGIACNVANTVIVKYQNNIDALSDLETKDQTS